MKQKNRGINWKNIVLRENKKSEPTLKEKGKKGVWHRKS